MPVPFDDIFPSTVIEGAETFDVEFDPVSSSTSSSSASSGTSTPDDDENSEAFGEVFIDSPNDQSVSSMAPVSDWVVTSCDPKSDQPQTVSMRSQSLSLISNCHSITLDNAQVLAYCSKSMDSSGCAHVFIGNAEHTIVQMPSSCGLGPYARVASLTPHTNQSILSTFHQAQKPANELVYSLSFDYGTFREL